MMSDLPACMMPDGDDPCEAFARTYAAAMDAEHAVTQLRALLSRCRTILENMALENEGSARIFRRWPISDEPLRSDAKNLLPLLDEALKT